MPPTAEVSYLPRRSEHDDRDRRHYLSASALALHLDCSRTYIAKLEAEGVIQRQGDGFPLDQSRVAYLRYLRRERQQSPRTEADRDKAHLVELFEALNASPSVLRRDDASPKPRASV